MTAETPDTTKFWKADTETPELADSLRTALREIKDPELGMDIIQLGLIREVEISDAETYIKMILTTIYCPYGPTMLEDTRKKAEEALNRPARLELGMDMWDFSMMEDGVDPTWGIF